LRITMRHGKFRIAKQTGSSAHFASVALNVELATADEVVIEAESTAIRGWGNAVRTGVEQAVQIARALGHHDPVRVAVTEFVGMPTDTSDEDARAAAVLATLSAFLEPSALPSLRFSTETAEWLIEWPGTGNATG